MEELIALDKKLFLYLNQLHTPWLDPVMYLMSETYPWFPLYAFLLYLIVKNYGAKSWIMVVCIAAAITAADRVTTGILKPLCMRLRPTHDPDFGNMVHYVNDYKGSLYGFASSHAANVFALAIFFWLLFHERYKSVSVLFAWAAMVAYTRIYLGVHFPGDVLAGALIGILAGFLGFKLCTWTVARTEKRDRLSTTGSFPPKK